jgi:enoyl-CoA hydratase/carnithine racemase
MAEETKVRLDVDGPVAELVLNRPEKLNAIDGDCLELIEAHMATVAGDPSIRAVVVRGEGRAFCAGADLSFLGDKVSDPEVFGAFLTRWHRAYDAIASSATPTIAAVHGVALAGGFELLQVCDLAVLADDARIGDQHARYGLFPGGGSTQRLPRLISERRARWLLYSGEWVSPQEALVSGLVNEVQPADRALERAREMARLLASRSPLATANIKQAIRLGSQTDLSSALQIEQDLAVAHMTSEDVQIGLQAFRSRTEPHFVGR